MVTTAAVRWSSTISRFEASGQSVRDFAASNNLNPRTLAWWRWRLRRDRQEGPGAGDAATTGGAFVELEVSPEARATGTAARVVVELDGYAARVVVDRTSDLEVVRDLLEALC